MTDEQKRGHDNCCVWGDCTDIGTFFIETAIDVVFICPTHAADRTTFLEDQVTEPETITPVT